MATAFRKSIGGVADAGTTAASRWKSVASKVVPPKKVLTNVPDVVPPNKVLTNVAGAGAGAAKKADDVVKGATAAQTAAGETIEKSGVFKTFLKNNSGKLAIAGVTAASLGIYMAVTGESNPAKALGQMVGDVGSGVGDGLGDVVGGLLDSLGITPYLTYIQWGCAASSCLCCLLLVLYFIIQFKK